MRLAIVPRLAVAFLLLASVGCSSNNKGKIEGTKWVNKATIVKGQNLPAGLIRMEFKADGTYSQTILADVTTGKYVLGAGDTITLNVDKPKDGNKKLRSDFTITGTTMVMKDPDGTSITFDKAP